MIDVEFDAADVAAISGWVLCALVGGMLLSEWLFRRSPWR